MGNSYQALLLPSALVFVLVILFIILNILGITFLVLFFPPARPTPCRRLELIVRAS